MARVRIEVFILVRRARGFNKIKVVQAKKYMSDKVVAEHKEEILLVFVIQWTCAKIQNKKKY